MWGAAALSGTCLTLQVAGVPRPLPAGQQVLDVDSYLDSSVLDTSFLSFPGLQTEVRGPGHGRDPTWAGGPISLVQAEACFCFSIGLCYTSKKPLFSG